jgi:hypothetical protein
MGGKPDRNMPIMHVHARAHTHTHTHTHAHKHKYLDFIGLYVTLRNESRLRIRILNE